LVCLTGLAAEDRRHVTPVRTAAGDTRKEGHGERFRERAGREAEAVLLVALAGQNLDVVLTNAPVGPGFTVRAHSHLLGASRMSFLGTPALARTCRRGFPASLHGKASSCPPKNIA
jgi:hypothetical protein